MTGRSKPLPFQEMRRGGEGSFCPGSPSHLTIRALKGENTPTMSTNRQVKHLDTDSFLRTHPVFTLAEFSAALGPYRSTSAAKERLKYHAGRGRVRMLERGLYAAVPAGLDAARYWPDRFLAAAALRPAGIFSHHAALELLGAAHSEWNECTVLTNRRRRPLRLGNVEVRFLGHPAPLRRLGRQELGTRDVERSGRILRVTGPERTLVDGFRQPKWAGGLEELVESAAGFGVFDLELLQAVLEAFDQGVLWGAVGWFLDRYQSRFFVPPEYLAHLESRRPRSPSYVPRSERGGVLVRRWNLVLPPGLAGEGGPGEA
jgi:predicted transcriptional regulator of viral defense system